MSELTTEQIAEIEGRRAAIVTQWEYYPSRMAVLAGTGHSEPQVTATVYDDVTGAFIANAGNDIDRLLAEIKALKADNERLREIMAWLGKGKMRPMERRYQAFLRYDAEQGYDDTPPDYVEWLEQIASGDIHLVETPAVNMDAGQEAD